MKRKITPAKVKSAEQGFSLVELMIVVAIIGVLSSVALPRFRGFQANARTSEAKANLSHIYTLEETYRTPNGEYANVAAIGAQLGNTTTDTCGTANDIGFVLKPCGAGKVAYQYTVTGASTTAFAGQAITGVSDFNRVFPGCAAANTWVIDQDKLLEESAGPISGC